MTERSSGRCEVCGEVRERATKTECFACYRARKRTQERPDDQYVPALSHDGRRLVKAFAKVLDGLGEMRVGRTDVLAVLDVVRPYLRPVAEYLSLREPEHSIAFAFTAESIETVHVDDGVDAGEREHPMDSRSHEEEPEPGHGEHEPSMRSRSLAEAEAPAPDVAIGEVPRSPGSRRQQKADITGQ